MYSVCMPIISHIIKSNRAEANSQQPGHLKCLNKLGNLMEKKKRRGEWTRRTKRTWNFDGRTKWTRRVDKI
ncbi:hypothetical protein RIF29_07124 [Crotalaria pallida]|uniref:Uncharacterized protein n=1 Tax=Crotalaria pallida TaxID=3830 RepID=A0AAN9J465_CROPI